MVAHSARELCGLCRPSRVGPCFSFEQQNKCTNTDIYVYIWNNWSAQSGRFLWDDFGGQTVCNDVGLVKVIRGGFRQ